MRGINAPGVGFNDLATQSPESAALELSYNTSIGPQMAAIGSMLSNADANVKNHVELNQMFPEAPEKFSESMSVDQARYLVERQMVKRDLENNISKGGSGVGKFAASALGGLLDPVGNTIGLFAGPAFKAAGIVGGSLASRIGVGIAENFVGNSVADAVSYKTSEMLQDEFDASERIKANLAGSVLLGTAFGSLAHIFRESPKLGETLYDAAEGRGISGLDPEKVRDIYNAHIAAENSGTHFPYEHGPFNQEGKFYSGSATYNEDFHANEHAVRDSEMGHERGVQMFSNENLAHAGALTEGSGPTGIVFEHNLADKKLLDGNIPLKEIGIPEVVRLTEIAMNYNNILQPPVKIRDLSLAGAYREVLKAYYAGRLSLDHVMTFEKALGADGLHFEMKDFRGQEHAPSHGVYLFDKEGIKPVGFKQAVPEAVGKMTPDRIQSIKIHGDDGNDRIFNYEKGFNKKGQEMWIEMKDRALKVPDNQLELPLDTVETKIDNSFNEAKKRITGRDQFEGHVDPETKAALEHADEAFKEANKLNKIYETVTACLR